MSRKNVAVQKTAALLVTCLLFATCRIYEIIIFVAILFSLGRKIMLQ
jgi:hypothetical protein